MEKQLEREIIYKGKILEVWKDKVEVDSKHIENREIIHHNGGVCLALKDSDDTYFLVKQYRYAFNDYLIEFPAGKLEKNEDHYNAMIREAKEETGCSVKNIQYHHYIVPTCGYSDEKIYLYSAIVDEHGMQNLEIGEDITIIKKTLPEIKSMINNNEIVDAKTIILTYKLQ